MLEQIVTAGGSVKSYESAATLLKSLAEVEISVRHVGQLTQRIGHELAATEDARIAAYRQRPLPRVATRPATADRLGEHGLRWRPHGTRRTRAALLGDDNRLETHLRNRPGSPFASPPALPLAAAV